MQLNISIFLAVVIIIIKLVEVQTTSIYIINIKLMLEFLTTFLIVFMTTLFILVFINFIYYKSKNSSYILALLIFMSLLYYVYSRYLYLDDIAHIVTEGILYVGVLVLLISLFVFILGKLKLGALNNLIFVLFIPTSIFIINALNINYISDKEHANNKKEIYIEIGSIKSQIENYDRTSEILNNDNNTEQLSKIVSMSKYLFESNLKLIEESSTLRDFMKGTSFCQEWEKKDFKNLYDNNITMLKRIQFINDFCKTDTQSG